MVETEVPRLLLTDRVEMVEMVVSLPTQLEVVVTRANRPPTTMRGRMTTLTLPDVSPRLSSLPRPMPKRSVVLVVTTRPLRVLRAPPTTPPLAVREEASSL
jgi:hypothetical protein